RRVAEARVRRRDDLRVAAEAIEEGRVRRHGLKAMQEQERPACTSPYHLELETGNRQPILVRGGAAHTSRRREGLTAAPPRRIGEDTRPAPDGAIEAAYHPSFGSGTSPRRSAMSAWSLSALLRRRAGSAAARSFILMRSAVVTTGARVPPRS